MKFNNLLENKYNLNYHKLLDFYKTVIPENKLKLRLNKLKHRLNSKIIDDHDLKIVAILEIAQKKNYRLNVLDLGAGFGRWFFLIYMIKDNNKDFFYTAVEALKKRKKQFYKICKNKLFNTKNVKWIDKVINFKQENLNFYHGNISNWTGQSISINKYNKLRNFINFLLNKPYIKKISSEHIVLPKYILNEFYDLALIDLQGLEYELIENNIDQIKKNFKYLIIGTHDESTEMTPKYYDHPKLVNFLRENKFKIIFDYDQNTKNKYENFSVNIPRDGIIFAENKIL